LTGFGVEVSDAGARAPVRRAFDRVAEARQSAADERSESAKLARFSRGDEGAQRRSQSRLLSPR